VELCYREPTLQVQVRSLTKVMKSSKTAQPKKDLVRIVYSESVKSVSEGEQAINSLCDELEKERITLQKVLSAHSAYALKITKDL